MTFEEWWFTIGSGIIPTKDDDMESHAKKVALQAWIAATQVESDDYSICPGCDEKMEVDEEYHSGSIPCQDMDIVYW